MIVLILPVESIAPKWLTVKELSKKTGWTKDYIYDLCKSGKIPRYKFNGLLMFREDEIDSILDSCKVETKRVT